MTGAPAPARVRLREHRPAVRALLAGSLAALVGTEVFEVVVLMLTTAAYGAILSTGLLGVAMRLAPMVLSPVLTATLDRRPEQRPRFARLTVLARAVAIGAFALLLAVDQPPAWVAYLLIALIAALDTSYLSAARASVPGLLTGAPDREAHLSDASSRLVAQWNAVQILVPPVVVLVLQALAPSVLLAAVVAVLLAAFVLLGDVVRRAAEGESPAAPAATSLRERLAAGFRLILGNDLARSLTLVAMVSQGTVFAFSLALPVVVTDRASQGFVGVALAAMAVGSLVAARWAARLTTRRARVRAMYLTGVAQAALFALLALATRPAVVGVVFVLAGLVLGALAGVGAVARGTLLQSEFDVAVLGSLIVAVVVTSQLLMPVLPAAWSWLAASAGVPAAFLALAALQLGGVLLAVLGHPRHAPDTAGADR